MDVLLDLCELHIQNKLYNLRSLASSMAQYTGLANELVHDGNSVHQDANEKRDVWMKRRRDFRTLALGLFLLLVPLPTQAAQLVMIQAVGCTWCERWNEEIGTVYAKTEEGMRAPLRRIDMHDPLPADLGFLIKGVYTPTFVLIEDGREIGRIRGYPGEDFFWGLFQELLKKLPAQKQSAQATK
jgi:hypothetical protein